MVLPTGLEVSKATVNVYVLDSNIKTITTGGVTRKSLNINVYSASPTGTIFIRTIAFNVSDEVFTNATDRLTNAGVSGSIMRLTLDENKTQFYVNVEAAGTAGNPGIIYQFGSDQAI